MVCNMFWQADIFLKLFPVIIQIWLILFTILQLFKKTLTTFDVSIAT